MSNWAPGAVALVAFKTNDDVAEWRCSLSWSDLRQRGLCRVYELVKVSNWAPGTVALVY